MDNQAEPTYNEAGRYELLADEAAYVAYCQREYANYGDPPESYPCYVKKAFTATGDAEYWYLYPEQLAHMAMVVGSLAQSVSRD